MDNTTTSLAHEKQNNFETPKTRIERITVLITLHPISLGFLRTLLTPKTLTEQTHLETLENKNKYGHDHRAQTTSPCVILDPLLLRFCLLPLPLLNLLARLSTQNKTKPKWRGVGWGGHIVQPHSVFFFIYFGPQKAHIRPSLALFRSTKDLLLFTISIDLADGKIPKSCNSSVTSIPIRISGRLKT